MVNSARRASARPRSPLALASLGLMMLALAFPQPARADGAASTRNIILGAAAIATGIIIYNNVAHKAVAQRSIVGYTRDGGTIYGDGRVVYANGRTTYLSNGNGRPCGYAAGYGERCGNRPLAYARRGDGDDRRWRRQHHDGDDRGRDGDHGD